ncbi:MAG: glycosyltransferase family protein [Candidatus Omnitrophica bacterium]|nr:glycosyltransferase family protein [Candidatus Omnitrophota bacterium]
MKILEIIQARMCSTRLPGKALIKIMDKPMLWHVIDRASHSNLIDKIVVATSTNKEDDAIERFCKDNGFYCYRGSHEDVLDRYYQAANAYKPEAVVRITSDCPLIDPVVTDKVISCFLKNRKKFDGASNVINRTYPRGLDTEVISFLALERIWREAKLDYQREHVTIYAYENKKDFRLYSVENKKDLSGFRWTVDTAPDLEFITEIYKRLYTGKKIFLTEDVLRVLDKEPKLKDINKEVKQKYVRRG